MTESDGLDRWIDNPKPKFLSSLSSRNMVLDSLKERISELEKIHEQIQQEIIRLKSIQIPR